MLTEKNQIESVQMFPSKKRHSLNDKATKTLFYLTQEEFLKLIKEKKKYGVIEKKKHKSKGKIQSTFRLETSDDYIAFERLGELARDVFDVMTSEFEEGNRVISLAMIQRALSGKAGNKNKYHSAYTSDKEDKEMTAAIRKALTKMMCTIFDADVLKAYEELNYKGVEKIKKAPVLPGKICEVKLNGEVTEVFVMTDESPLYTIAKIKGQILTYDATPLDVPNQRNTVTVTKLKNYSYRRIVENKQHFKNMSSTLTLDDIFTKCEIRDDNKSKFDARAALNKFFAHLQKLGEIKSYEWTKKGTKFYSVEFTF
jgi:hypothetical protein